MAAICSLRETVEQQATANVEKVLHGLFVHALRLPEAYNSLAEILRDLFDVAKRVRLNGEDVEMDMLFVLDGEIHLKDVKDISHPLVMPLLRRVANYIWSRAHSDYRTLVTQWGWFPGDILLPALEVSLRWNCFHFRDSNVQAHVHHRSHFNTRTILVTFCSTMSNILGYTQRARPN